MNTESEYSPTSLQIEVQDRKDLLAIVNKLKQGSGLDEQSATQVGLGLRLLGPVMMQQWKHPLFVDFMPHVQNIYAELEKDDEEQLTLVNGKEGGTQFSTPSGKR